MLSGKTRLVSKSRKGTKAESSSANLDDVGLRQAGPDGDDSPGHTRDALLGYNQSPSSSQGPRTTISQPQSGPSPSGVHGAGIPSGNTGWNTYAHAPPPTQYVQPTYDAQYTDQIVPQVYNPASAVVNPDIYSSRSWNPAVAPPGASHSHQRPSSLRVDQASMYHTPSHYQARQHPATGPVPAAEPAHYQAPNNYGYQSHPSYAQAPAQPGWNQQPGSSALRTTSVIPASGYSEQQAPVGGLMHSGGGQSSELDSRKPSLTSFGG